MVRINKEQSKKVGRPSVYEKIDFKQLKKLILKGWIDKEVAEFYGVKEVTIFNWKKEHPEFMSALKEWKLEADEKVEKSLYQRALGYKYDEITYEKSKTGGLGIHLTEGEVSDIKHVDTYKTKITVKEVAADVTACIFWLKNRKPEQWREKHEVVSKEEITVRVIHEEVEERLNCLSSLN